MNRYPLYACIAIALNSSFALGQSTTPAKPLSIRNADSVVPIELPAYELRVLDRKQRLLVDIDAERTVEIPLPIYIYFPKKKGPNLAEKRELELIYNDLAKAQARVQDGDLHEILLRLDKVVRDYGSDELVGSQTAVSDDAETLQSPKKSRVSYEKVMTASDSPAASEPISARQEKVLLPLTPPKPVPVITAVAAVSTRP